MWTASARVQYGRSGERYAGDVTDAEFALIEPLLPRPKRGGRPRTTSLREVLNAILYVLRTACPWAMLPRVFPPRSTVCGAAGPAPAAPSAASARTAWGTGSGWC